MYDAGSRKHYIIVPLLLVMGASSAAVALAFFYVSGTIVPKTDAGDEIAAADAAAEQPALSPPGAETPSQVAAAASAAPLPASSTAPAAERATPRALPAPTDVQDGKADPSQVVDVPILVYHSVMPHHPEQTKMQVRYDVAPEIFDRQMQYLKDGGFDVMPMDELVKDLAAGTKPPDKSAVINFDDGYWNQYKYALPILQKYGLTATFFICTHCLGKSIYMTWTQVQDLAHDGMTIGDHSATHPVLFAIKDADRLDQEVGASKQELEKAIGLPVDLFAYPFGKPSPEAEDAVRRAGYSAARIFQGGLLNSKKDLFVLRSVIVTDSFADFEKSLAGAGTVR